MNLDPSSSFDRSDEEPEGVKACTQSSPAKQGEIELTMQLCRDSLCMHVLNCIHTLKGNLHAKGASYMVQPGQESTPCMLLLLCWSTCGIADVMPPLMCHFAGPLNACCCLKMKKLKTAQKFSNAEPEGVDYAKARSQSSPAESVQALD